MPDKKSTLSLMNRRELIIGLAAGTVVPFVSGCADNAALGLSLIHI